MLNTFKTKLQGTAKCVGLLILAGVVYWFTSWRALNYTSCVLLLSCFLVLVIPESPQWLLTNESPEAAADVLYKMAKMNGVEMAQGSIQLQRAQKDEDSNQESGNVLMILRNKEFLIITLKFFYQWFVVSLLFYGFYYSLEGISGSVVVNFAIMGALEVFISF